MIKRIISDFKLTEISITPNGYEVGYQIIRTNGMIKDTELRKGNLLILNISYKDNIHRVDEIYTDEVKVTSIEDGGCFPRMKVSTCKPIPLTPEWLERCGFVSTLSGDDFHSDIIWDDPKSDYHYCEAGYFIDNRGDYGRYCDIGDVKYLHQLQNLYFALTGDELTIKEPA